MRRTSHPPRTLRERSRFPMIFTLLVATSAAVDLACRDAPTEPRPHSLTAVTIVGASGDSAPAAVFLPPLLPSRSSGPGGPPDTVGAPAVVICRVRDDVCADTMARFSSDSSTPDSMRVQRDTERTVFAASWNTSAVMADTATVYRAQVTVGDTLAGSADFKIVAPGTPVPAEDSARYAYVTMQDRLAIRFQLYLPRVTLTVLMERGVHGVPESGTTPRRAGERVSYRFVADSGYTNVLTMLDGDYAGNAGTVVMDRPHVLAVSADRVVTVDAEDAALLRQARSVLSASNPASAFQRLIDSLRARPHTGTMDERIERLLQKAFDPIKDSAALRRIDALMAGHDFRISDGTTNRNDGNGTGGTDGPPSDGGGGSGGGGTGDGSGSGGNDGGTGAGSTGGNDGGSGGGGIAFNRLTPQNSKQPPSVGQPVGQRPVAQRQFIPTLATARDISQYADEPVAIAYVNGIYSPLARTLFVTRQLDSLVRASPWRGDVPFTIRMFYNRSVLDAPNDSVGRLTRCMLSLNDRLGMGMNSIPIYLASCSKIPIHDILHHFDDLVEAGRQWLDRYGDRASSATTGADARQIANLTTAWRRKQYHVLFVSHSQGNLMVEDAVDALVRDHTFDQPHDTTCLGAVSLAAPRSDGWPIADRHLRGLTVSGDAIGVLATNHFERIVTALSHTADTDVLVLAGTHHPLWASIRRLVLSVGLHDVVDSYFNQDASRERIQRSIVDVYGSCAISSVHVSPRIAHIVPGESRQYTATLIAQDGLPLDGVRPVVWTVRYGAAAIRATTSKTATTVTTITANYVGGGGVHATASTRSDEASAVVDPLTVALTATERLSGELLFIPGSYASGATAASPPRSIAGGAWSGGTCTATKPWHHGTSVAAYGQVCTASYPASVAPVKNAGKYDFTFFTINSRSEYASQTGPSRSVTESRSSGLPSWGAGDDRPPDLVDRINVSVWDKNDHLLGFGRTCVHGCLGWSDM